MSTKKLSRECQATAAAALAGSQFNSASHVILSSDVPLSHGQAAKSIEKLSRECQGAEAPGLEAKKGDRRLPKAAASGAGHAGRL